MDTTNLNVSPSPTYRDSPPPPVTLGLHPGRCVHAGDTGAAIQALLQQAALVLPTQHRQCSICGHIVPTGNVVHTVRRIDRLMCSLVEFSNHLLECAIKSFSLLANSLDRF